MSSAVTFFLNGRKTVIENAQPETTLLEYIRGEGLTGTKLTCGEGGCGACTVMVSRYNWADKAIEHLAVNACLYPLCAVDFAAVTTVEGIGRAVELHPIQERLAAFHGSQCGFCTPGIVMAMYALLRTRPHITPQEIEDSFDGNLCRCTGYRPILDAMKTFGCPKGEACCQNGGGGGGCGGNGAEGKHADVSVDTISVGKRTFTGYDPTAEPIFPPFLMLNEPQSLKIQGKQVTWLRPTTLAELLSIKHNEPACKIIMGNTEVGIEVKFRNVKYPVLVNPGLVPELKVRDVQADKVKFGAAVTLTQLKETLQDIVSARGKADPSTRICSAFIEQLHWFASTQIRNAACIGGNLATASPISDLNPLWMAAGATLHLISSTGKRRDVAIADFFLSYRKTALQERELIEAVTLPLTRENEFMMAYKQARRRDDDIAIVGAGMRARFESAGNGAWKVAEVKLAYGGMAVVTAQCPKTEALLVGRTWDEETLKLALESLEADLPLAAGAPGGMIEYRRSLTTSFFFKFYLETRSQLLGEAGVDARDASAFARFERGLSSGTQDFNVVPEAEGPMNVSAPHVAANQQATGEAQYTDDIPDPARCLHSYLVVSTKANADIVSINTSIAENMPGVVAVLTDKDVRGANDLGAIVKDEELFLTEHSPFVGTLIGIVVAETFRQAKEAANAVVIEYEELGPPIVNIEQAIEAQSFYMDGVHTIEDGGDVEAALQASEVVVEGEMQIGGQEHFYLEPNTTLVIPGEDEEYTVISSTQNPSKTQMFVARALGISGSRVVSKVKRLGGGFGGKETRSVFIACAVAIAAQKTRRPVRIVLDRDMDMLISGQRHPFLGKYRVGATKEGKLQALDVQLYSNAGCSHDLSVPVLDRALFHCTNAYKVPVVRAVGRCCKTHLPTNTAFRGFGGPQGMMIAEAYMDKLARTLGVPTEQVREANMYGADPAAKELVTTHYKQEIVNCKVRECYKQVSETADFAALRAESDAFNAANRWRKRGLAIVPTVFGMSFTAKFMNQAGALVHVYTDGTVLVSHGGTEMGQGLNTKMIQVAAHELGIPASAVHITETATNCVPNTQPTAASVSSDLNGAAIRDACRKIKARLEPLETANPGKSWNEIVTMAYFDRVSLSATGFYATPDIGYDFEGDGGRPFHYHVSGAALSQIEVDTLTGDYHILRSDVTMDLGKSLNPALDVGQIEGGFIQGVGLFALEELIWSPTGALFSKGPSLYKLPSFNDVPLQMNIGLLKGSDNPTVVGSSKGVGEPPLFLGSSVFFALRDAVRAARAEAGLDDKFQLNSPATPERIRMACQDQFTDKFTENGEIKSNGVGV